MGNLLNLSKIDSHTPIYRIFSTDRLMEIFKKGKLTLVRPRLWEDPFENYILNKMEAVQVDSSKKSYYSEYKNSLYGQCWSLNKETDAMWRIYSPNRNGVKVKTTIEKLLESMELKMPHVRDISCYIGKVEYLWQKDLTKRYEIFKNEFKDDKSGIKKLVNTLLLKRKEFSHEDEIRLIYYEMWRNSKNDIFSFDIDPIYVFDEIVYDPRMNEYSFQAFKSFLKYECNYRLRIDKSKLYSLPNLSI